MDIAESCRASDSANMRTRSRPKRSRILSDADLKEARAGLMGEPSTASNADGDGGGWGAPRARFGADAWDAR